MVRTPQLLDLGTAIAIYYKYIEIGNKEIKALFGRISDTTVTKLKDAAREKMIEDDIMVWNARRVNTAAAFQAWGLDIDDLERRYNKLQKINAKRKETST